MLACPVPLLYTADETVRSRNTLSAAARRADASVVPLRPGVYVRRVDWRSLRLEQQHLTRVVAALTAGNPPTTVLARESAAVVHGIAMVGALPEQVQLCLPGARHGHRNAVSRASAAPSDTEVTEVGGHRVTSVAQTLLDLARTRDFRSSLVSVDAALHDGTVTWQALDEMFRAQVRRPGSRRARLVLDYADARAESPLESLSRATMIEARLPLPELQYRVRTNGVEIARVDHYWSAAQSRSGRPVSGEAHGRVKFEPGIAGDRAAERAYAELDRTELIRLHTGGECVSWGWGDALRRTEMLTRLAQAGIVPGARPPRPPRRPTE